MPTCERSAVDGIYLFYYTESIVELYLLAFGPLRSVFSPQELNELGITMAERGLRLRQGLDEALDGWAEPVAKRHLPADDEEAEDEIEYNARELRRLMPY